MTRRPDGSRNPTYMVWRTMKDRCLNPNSNNFHRYGGRGIKVCERWMKFENFLADMGEQPPGLVLDREANDGDYEPGNCRWTTRKVNSRNRCDNHMLTLGDETKTVADWADHLGIPHATLRGRIRLGWSTEQILTVAKRVQVRVYGTQPTDCGTTIAKKLETAVAKLRQWASECAECAGTGEVTVVAFPNGGEGTRVCDQCADICRVIAECAP